MHIQTTKATKHGLEEAQVMSDANKLTARQDVFWHHY